MDISTYGVQESEDCPSTGRNIADTNGIKTAHSKQVHVISDLIINILKNGIPLDAHGQCMILTSISERQ